MERYQLDIKITYNGNIYSFDTGIKAYIFHMAVYNDIDTDFGSDELMKFVNLLYACYIEADDDSGFGKLCDYVGENYATLKDKTCYEILDLFEVIK